MLTARLAKASGGAAAEQTARFLLIVLAPRRPKHLEGSVESIRAMGNTSRSNLKPPCVSLVKDCTSRSGTGYRGREMGWRVAMERLASPLQKFLHHYSPVTSERCFCAIASLTAFRR